ncbi:MAG: hypothetical protein EU541_07380 [Promethearchaeota archaeon]|nr:MAG: hypothetical protein EU541_07380 [Candidatus Lokiarchaeota archaeon]
MKTITELNWGFFEIFLIIVTALIGFAITYFLMPFIIKYMKKNGHIGRDIHKNSKPKVAESGGIGILIGFVISSILLMVFFPIFLNDLIIILFTILLAGVIGFLDDKIKLRSRYKIGLTLFLGLLIFIANQFNFIQFIDPTLPILGKMRLTILFPVLIPVIITVFANTVNMLEGYNGEGSGTCLIALGFLILSSIFINSAEGLLYSVVFFAIILGFFFYNKYPAKIFPGDIGTLSMGVMIAIIALFGNLLYIAFCALLLHVFNSFLYITSVRGFFESEEIHRLRDDIILLEDDRIKASEENKALMTIPRLILSKEPLKEDGLVNHIYIISFLCGILALFSAFLVSYTMESIDLLMLLIFGLILLIPICVLLYFFKRITEIALIIFSVYCLLFLVLLFVDLIILPYIRWNINLIIVNIPLNMIISVLLVIPILIIWYYLTQRYFWFRIKANNNQQ